MAEKTPTIAAASPPSAPVGVQLVRITRRLWELRDLADRVERARSANRTAHAEPFLTVEEASALLRVNTKTLYAAIDDGEIPGARRIRGVLRIRRDALLAHFDGPMAPRPKSKRKGRRHA